MNRQGLQAGLAATVLLVGVTPAVVMLSSCTHWVRSLPPNTQFDGASEDAIIVLKVEPVARVSMVPGTIDRTGWEMSPGHTGYGAWAEDGTIIIKVKPRTGRETYGITVLTPDDGRYARYQATRGILVPSFHAIAGQVTFIGSIRIERSESADALTVAHNEWPDDEEKVAKLMRRRYPSIRAKVVMDIFDMLPRKDKPNTNGSLIAAPFRDD